MVIANDRVIDEYFELALPKDLFGEPYSAHGSQRRWMRLRETLETVLSDGDVLLARGAGGGVLLTVSSGGVRIVRVRQEPKITIETTTVSGLHGVRITELEVLEDRSEDTDRVIEIDHPLIPDHPLSIFFESGDALHSTAPALRAAFAD